jgi:hypothetical protein
MPMTMGASDLSKTALSVCKGQKPGGLEFGQYWVETLKGVEVGERTMERWAKGWD